MSFRCYISIEELIELRRMHELSFGVPKIRNILNSSSISESPGNNGPILDISAKIQPTLHISMAVEYVFVPSNTSGARYQSVTTS